MHSLFDLSLAQGLTLTPGGGAPAGAEFFSLPYPNALRLDADGTPALAGFFHQDELIGGYVDVIDQHSHGFGPTQAVYVRFDGPIDPATLPDAAGSLLGGASAFLVDVTTGSAHRGEKIPLRFRFETLHLDFIGDNWLAMQPVPGYPPREGETYAAVVTDAVHDADGKNVGAPSSLRRVLEGSPDGALEQKAADAFAPLATWLGEHALDGHVVAATVYTTAVGSRIMDDLRTAVLATPAPALAELMHVSTADAYELYTAHYDGPNFQEGDPPYTFTGGELHRDASGTLTPVRTESLRIALTIPKGTMPAEGWPVVIYSHGTGGDFMSFVDDGTAARLAVVHAKDGTELTRFAVVSTDQVLHGPRAPVGTDVDTAFFNFNNLVAARDNVKQGALDDFQVLRLVKTINVAAAPTVEIPIRFDPTKIYYFGHSQGSLTGGLFVAAEPELKGAVFSGAGAGLVAALLTKAKPVDIGRLVQSFFRDPVDDFHPFLNLLQGYFDESDPANYARRYFLEPPAGTSAKNVLVTLGLRDSYSPVPTIETFAVAAGVVPVNPALAPIEAMALDGRAWKDAPQVENVAGGVTGVVCEYDPGGGEGHFVVFNVHAAQVQSTRFLATHAATGSARLDPP